MNSLPSSKRFTYGSHVRPYPGLRVSGDIAVIAEGTHGLFVAMIDVLGHGHAAAAVARQMDGFLRSSNRNLSDIAEVARDMHRGLQSGLGAAASILWCERATGEARYLGVGNTVARCFRKEAENGAGTADKRLTSRDGTLGQILPDLTIQAMQLGPGDSVVMYTDGVSDRFQRSDYPMLTRDRVQTVAESLVSRFGKAHDDSSALCMRWTA